MPLLIAGIVIAVLLVTLIAIVLIRTLAFRVRPVSYSARDEIEINEEKALADLAEMIKIKTVSSRVKSEEDDAEFDKFEELLKDKFDKPFTEKIKSNK